MNTISLVIFDLDGTLVDSALDIAWCADRTLEQLDRPTLGIDIIRNYVGNGIPTLIKRILTQEMNGEPEAALFDKALPIFFDYYRANVSQFSRLYDGVVEALAALESRNIVMAVATNKAEELASSLLQNLGIDHYFAHIVGGDTLAQKKPDPLPLLHIAKNANTAIENCLMVGDSKHDIAAAKAAKMKVLAVPYGYNHGEDIRLSEPDFVLESLADLPALLSQTRQ